MLDKVNCVRVSVKCSCCLSNTIPATSLSCWWLVVQSNMCSIYFVLVMKSRSQPWNWGKLPSTSCSPCCVCLSTSTHCQSSVRHPAVDWVCEWMSVWVSVWVSEWVSVSERVGGWVSECVGEWMCEWMCGWEWVSDWVSDWVSEWLSEWASEQTSEWANEWASEWIYTVQYIQCSNALPWFNSVVCWLSRRGGDISLTEVTYRWITAPSSIDWEWCTQHTDVTRWVSALLCPTHRCY